MPFAEPRERQLHLLCISLKSAAGVPSSCCFTAATICLTGQRLRFIPEPAAQRNLPGQFAAPLDSLPRS